MRWGGGEVEVGWGGGEVGWRWAGMKDMVLVLFNLMFYGVQLQNSCCCKLTNEREGERREGRGIISEWERENNKNSIIGVELALISFLGGGGGGFFFL